MDPDVLRTILTMLTARKVLCLATAIDGEPAASLLPFAMAPDFLAVYVQASLLAKHSRSLQAGGQVSVLIHGLDTDDVDPLQIARLTVQATIEPLERGSDEFARASEVFVGRLPSAAVTLGFEDFRLYRLRLGQGRFVAGFAQAYDVGPEAFRDIAGLRRGIRPEPDR
jgi:heme iron utilization protein